jgi:hypothetical protein
VHGGAGRKADAEQRHNKTNEELLHFQPLNSPPNAATLYGFCISKARWLIHDNVARGNAKARCCWRASVKRAASSGPIPKFANTCSTIDGFGFEVPMTDSRQH